MKATLTGMLVAMALTGTTTDGRGAAPGLQQVVEEMKGELDELRKRVGEPVQ